MENITSLFFYWKDHGYIININLRSILCYLNYQSYPNVDLCGVFLLFGNTRLVDFMLRHLKILDFLNKILKYCPHLFGLARHNAQW